MKTVYNVVKVGLLLSFFVPLSSSLSMQQQSALPTNNNTHNDRSLEKRLISAITHMGAAGTGYAVSGFGTMFFFFSTPDHNKGGLFTALNTLALLGTYGLSKVLPNNSHTTALISGMAIPFGIAAVYYPIAS